MVFQLISKDEFLITGEFRIFDEFKKEIIKVYLFQKFLT